MIVCKLAELSGYRSLLPELDEVMESIKKIHVDGAAADLERNEMTFSVQTGKTKDFCPQAYEAHRKYIDVHYIIEGGESIYYQPVKDLEPVKKYDEEKDVAWYKGKKEAGSAVWLYAGMCCVLFPEDGHMPCRHGGQGETSYKKVVIKLPYKQR